MGLGRAMLGEKVVYVHNLHLNCIYIEMKNEFQSVNATVGTKSVIGISLLWWLGLDHLLRKALCSNLKRHMHMYFNFYKAMLVYSIFYCKTNLPLLHCEVCIVFVWHVTKLWNLIMRLFHFKEKVKFGFKELDYSQRSHDSAGRHMFEADGRFSSFKVDWHIVVVNRRWP